MISRRHVRFHRAVTKKKKRGKGNRDARLWGKRKRKTGKGAEEEKNSCKT